MRPSTQVAYNRHFRNFLLFLTYAAIVIEQLSLQQLLSYCEFLHINGHSASAIANALAGIKSRMQSYGLQVAVFSDVRVNYFLKSLRLNQPSRLKMPHIIDFALLRKIVYQCNSYPHSMLFRSVYLVAFYSFLRISNLVPHSIHTFSPLHQLARGDVFFAPPGVHLLIKWSKTLQNKDKAVILKLPTVSDVNICPVHHLRFLLHSTPGHQDSPLFQVQLYNNWVPLTDSRVRKHLKDCSMLSIYRMLISLFTHLGNQGLPWPSRVRHPCRASRPTAPGPLTLSGPTLSRIRTARLRWPTP